MASNYTGLGVQLMTTGEKAGTWGTLTNTNWNIMEQISGGYIEQSIAGGEQTTTLSVSDGSAGAVLAHRIIKFTGSITGNQTVTIPLDVQTFYIILNGTTDGSGTPTVNFKYVTGSGSSVTWAASDKGTKIIYATADDGTNPNIVDVGYGTGDVTLTGTQTLTNKTLTSPKIGTSILDTNGLQLALLTATGSAVNEFTVANAAAGAGPTLSATGDDTNVPINITPKGSGDVFINPPTSGSLIVSGTSTQAGKIVLQADTDDTGSFVASFQPGVLTESTAYILPLADAGTSGDALTSNASGTLSWTTISGGTSWQSVTTGTTVTTVAGSGYPINTTSNVCTATLPAASVGDEVSFIDYARTFDSNNLTVTANGSEKIYASTDDLTVAVEGSGFTLVYVDATQGWLLKDK
jgi:hypothetical protein